ncbi:16S rRNA (adenine(1518)-N(6)/adenine(1519)-N(6))-dimethyltransferase RsmA [Parafilimonas terrae]|jgi:16S rRNA (adenine1518-N6/adenine1519-N6)-dimethyltransferase|uniref:Ribosomal RNA small subunit methyltransferase A n=1 Tax=Parafilimonas terrae TaxID=1465490 RepID=A0A1I5YJQ9_9BACT|nr:16S rRNA (adenine(1518)-N(6)/adenine(1519)-N(6))-dimethyltransferase RsmA [Parafilimonas terrae]SFQ44454.1 dimethyladenosine transferase [Parafilimonas terrae]
MQYTLKKSLGQHFLKDDNISRNIVSALTKHPFNNLFEIGPGGGALTKFLVQLNNINFKAIEFDTEKVEYLLHTYPSLKGKLIHEDFLKASLPFEDEFTVIGNFPYNISSQILFKILEWKEHVPLVIGMFQKEVAQRIASKPNTKVYGILSVLIQAFYNVDYLFDVPPSAFNPPPKVMSGVIELTLKKEPLNASNKENFFLLVKTAFNQRRKKMRNAARNLFNEDILQAGIFDKRAEQLSIEEFAALTFKMK